MVTEKLQINVWGFSVLCVLVSVYLHALSSVPFMQQVVCGNKPNLQPIIGPYLPRHLLASQLVIPPVHIAHTLLYAVFCYVSFTL